jgi:hypothetical protein
VDGRRPRSPGCSERAGRALLCSRPALRAPETTCSLGSPPVSLHSRPSGRPARDSPSGRGALRPSPLGTSRGSQASAHRASVSCTPTPGQRRRRPRAGGQPLGVGPESKVFGSRRSIWTPTRVGQRRDPRSGFQRAVAVGAREQDYHWAAQPATERPRSSGRPRSRVQRRPATSQGPPSACCGPSAPLRHAPGASRAEPMCTGRRCRWWGGQAAVATGALRTRSR